MKTHNLKIKPLYLDGILSTAKTFEIRKDDRAYKLGDYLRLSDGKRVALVAVSYLSTYEQKQGFVVLGIKLISMPAINEDDSRLPESEEKPEEATRKEVEIVKAFAIQAPFGWCDDVRASDSMALTEQGAWQKFCNSTLDKSAYQRDGYRAKPITIEIF